MHVASAQIPPFPGTQNISETRVDCRSFHTSACSLPPLPITSIFIFSKTLRINQSGIGMRGAYRKSMSQSLLDRLLHYKPGSAFTIISVLVLFFGMILITRYRMTGHVNLRAMIDQGTETKPFWERNPHLELVDSYPHTGLVVVRDRPTGRTAMVDLAVGLNAQVRPVSCDDSGGFRSEMIFSGAEEIVCFTIDKPDTGAGTLFIGGAS